MSLLSPGPCPWSNPRPSSSLNGPQWTLRIRSGMRFPIGELFQVLGPLLPFVAPHCDLRQVVEAPRRNQSTGSYKRQILELSNLKVTKDRGRFAATLTGSSGHVCSRGTPGAGSCWLVPTGAPPGAEPTGLWKTLHPGVRNIT